MSYLPRNVATMDLETTLTDVFGLTGFRPGQRAVVDSVLSGRPTVAVMPTGAGKSLCYQLPAVVTGGTALIVSPLIALMKDQVDALAARGIPSCAISSAMGPGEQAQRLDDLAAGRLRLVYVAPERFRSPRFEDALGRLGDRLSLIAIDEAHCISEWGHDFRPDYLRLTDVVARHRPPRLLAVTATATPEVRRDIVKRLGMESPAVFVRGFDRPNLSFQVERIGGGKEKKAERLCALVAQRKGGAALVYAATRKNAESYAEELRRMHVKARAYHAGLDDAARTRIQDQFMSGELDVIVATNAFGMGVDKSDIRLVVHADLPRSPEAYYQEAGRAGRDGEAADCVLLFQHSDVRLQEYLIDAGAPALEVLRAIWRGVREDPRRGADERLLRKVVPGEASEAQVAAAIRLLVRAGYLRERDGMMEAVKPGDDPSTPAPAPLDAAALSQRAEVERAKLRSMTQYAYATTCRRKYILEYFGDEDARGVPCGTCDVCAGQGRRELDDQEQRTLQIALRMVGRLRGRFGRTKIAAVLCGTDDDERLMECPERGALRSLGARYVMDVLRAAEGAGLVTVSPGEYPTLALTAQGQRVADGVQAVEMWMPDAAASRTKRKRSDHTVAARMGRGGPDPASPVGGGGEGHEPPFDRRKAVRAAARVQDRGGAA
jgi:ATP-dependent DNA helicase RecQ